MTSFFANQGYQEEAFAVVLQGDGKIVAGGYGIPPGFGVTVFTLVRYSPMDGSPDPSYGTEGTTIPGGVRHE